MRWTETKYIHAPLPRHYKWLGMGLCYVVGWLRPNISFQNLFKTNITSIGCFRLLMKITLTLISTGESSWGFFFHSVKYTKCVWPVLITFIALCREILPTTCQWRGETYHPLYYYYIAVLSHVFANRQKLRKVEKQLFFYKELSTLSP